MTERNLLSVREATKLLPLKESTIRAWILKQKLPYVKLGRRVFIRRADIESLIAESIVPARKRVASSAGSRRSDDSESGKKEPFTTRRGA